MADWDKIRKEYIKDDSMSYRKLAAKYGVSRTAIEGRSKAEGWIKKRSQKKARAVAKVVETLAVREAAVDCSVWDAADLLLGAYRSSLELAMTMGMTPDALQKFSGALRNIQMVLDSKPKELDIEEQRARIDKLRQETAQQSEEKSITVMMEGGIEDYAG